VFGDKEEFYKLPEKIQHVLVNMCFNLGGTRLSKFRKMLQACREHNWNRNVSSECKTVVGLHQVGRRSIELQQVVLDQI
jgi:GH24 family phage-related lysozyme (muramidase)